LNKMMPTMTRRGALCTGLIFLVGFLCPGVSAAAGAECLSLSPTLQAGKNPYVRIEARELTPDEQSMVTRLFQSLIGNWSASAASFFCSSAENPDDIEKDLETGRARVNLSYDGHLEIDAEFYSSRKSARRQEKLNLYRSSHALRFAHDTSAGDVELIEIADGTLAFLYRRVLTLGRGSSRREHFFTLSSNGGAMVIEQKLYIQGKLSSGETWRLNKQ
jgi:hypothetical protein